MMSGRSPGSVDRLSRAFDPTIRNSASLRSRQDGQKEPGGREMLACAVPHHEQQSRIASRLATIRQARLALDSPSAPQASKNCTSCLRAPSSFHLRSRLTISSRLVASSAIALGVQRRSQGQIAPDDRPDSADFLVQLRSRGRSPCACSARSIEACAALRRGVLALGGRHQCRRLPGLLDRTGRRRDSLGEPRKCGDIGRVLLQDLGIDRSRG